VSDFFTKKLLSPPRRQLLELMQRLSFCRIENLAVLGGEPVFDPPPRVTQDIRIGGRNGPRQELDLDDFTLPAPAIELFEHLNRIGTGKIALIDVREGHAVRLVIEQPVSEERT
jgi:hypothetical protein